MKTLDLHPTVAEVVNELLGQAPDEFKGLSIDALSDALIRKLGPCMERALGKGPIIPRLKYPYLSGAEIAKNGITIMAIFRGDCHSRRG